MNTIAIDCGASFIKAARVIGEDGIIEKILIRKTPKSDKYGFMLEKSVPLIKKLILELAQEDEEIKVGFSTEMHGFVLTNKEGKVLHDYVSWQDECAYERYGDGTYLSYVEKLIDITDIRKTGMPLKAGLPNVNLFYLLQNQLKGINNDNVYFYTLGDYYIRVLSDVQPYIHNTNAAATGLFDLLKETWNENIIMKLGITGIHFPKLYDGQPPVKCKLNNVVIFFYPAIGDQQAALLGCEFKNKGSVSLNFGTGAQISVMSEKVVLDDTYQTRPYFEHMYILTIPHIPSGRALNVYFNFIKQIVNEFCDCPDEKIWDFILEQAEQNDLKNLSIDMSFFANAITNHTTGYIGNITEKNFFVGNLFASIYDQMVNNIKTILQRMGIYKMEELILSGGVLRKSTILQKMIQEEFKNINKIRVAENETIKGIYKFVNSK